MSDTPKDGSEKKNSGESKEQSRGAKVLQLNRVGEAKPRPKGERAVLQGVCETRDLDVRRPGRPHNPSSRRVGAETRSDKSSDNVPPVSQQEESAGGEDESA